MEQYISKDALVAEIERIKKEECPTDTYEGRCKLLWFEQFLSFINTLEVKEVDSIWNDARKTIPEDSSKQIICIKEDDLAVATVGKLVHGTKKWAYLHDLLNISNVQAKEVDLEEQIELQIRNLQGVHVIENGQNWWHGTYDDLREFARYFAEHSVYGSQAEDLEKAAEEYDGTMYLSDAFIAGANWQKEQMMKDATKIEVKIDAGGYPYIPQIELYDYGKDIPLAKKGDKVKIIIMTK